MNNLENLDPQQRTELARTIVQILSDWGVEPAHQIILMGLPAETRARAMSRYRMGGAALPDDQDCLLRAHYILRIQNAVESMYPHSTQVGNYWITTPNAFFSNRTPLEVMLTGGIDSMESIMHHLNGTGTW